MKSFILSFFLTLLCINIDAQQECVKYYKNVDLIKTGSESKAKFKIIMYGYDETIDSVKAENIKKECL